MPRILAFHERLAADQLRVESLGEIRFPAEDLALMIEFEAQSLANPLQSRVRFRFVLQQCLPIQNLVDPSRVVVPLDSRRQKLVGLVELLGVLVVDAVVVVIILGAGNQLFERLGPVFGESKVLDVANLFRTGRAGHSDREAGDKHEAGPSQHGIILSLSKRSEAAMKRADSSLPPAQTGATLFQYEIRIAVSRSGHREATDSGLTTAADEHPWTERSKFDEAGNCLFDSDPGKYEAT